MSASHRFSRFGLHEMLLGEGKRVKPATASASSSSRPPPQEVTPMEVEPQSHTVHHTDPRKTYARKHKRMSLRDFFIWQASLPPGSVENSEGPVRPEGDPNWPEHTTEAQEKWDAAQVWVEKNLEEWGEHNAIVFAHMEHYGLHVMLEVDSLAKDDFQPVTTYEEHPKWERQIDMFDKETHYTKHTKTPWWDYEREEYGYEEEKKKNKPLLMIKTRPVEDKFIHRIGRAVTEAEMKWDYHISLAFTNEIHRFDLLDSAKGVELGKKAYNGLRDLLHEKRAVLRGHMEGSTFRVEEIALLKDESDEVGETLGMPNDIIRLHNTGEYCNRSIHVSM